MTPTPEQLAMARRIADGVILNGSSRDAARDAALAAIIETTERAAEYADNLGQCANTSGRGPCCEGLGEDIALNLRDGDHLKGQP